MSTDTHTHTHTHTHTDTKTYYCNLRRLGLMMECIKQLMYTHCPVTSQSQCTVQITRKFNASCESLASARQALASTRFPLASARKLHAWVFHVSCAKILRYSCEFEYTQVLVRVQARSKQAKSSSVRLVYE